MMSKSKTDINIHNTSLSTTESKKISNNLMPKNTLFAEIMRNHSGQSTPVSGEPLNFNVKDVPLPDECSLHLKKKIKSDRPRKRNHDVAYDLNSKKKKPHEFKTESQRPRVEIKNENIKPKMPKLCEARTHIRQNSTWGERSVKAFKILSEVGEGTYGHVFKAVDRCTNVITALKKVRLENEREGFPITTVREIKILQQLNHKNIVKLHEVVTDYDLNDSLIKEKNAKDKGFYLVFEYMDHDLYGILDSGISLSEIQIASITKQILEGINYSHKKMFLHRDIKCSNILINNKGEIKIADYGLSRRFCSDNGAKRRPYTNKVITLWYRAPELLLGEEYYGTSIDMWSIGCIMGELFTHRTMFVANTEMEQLDAISRVCGTPSPETWPDVVKLPLYQTYRPRFSNKRRLREYYFTVPNHALDILDWLLKLDPKRRCSAEQALASYWFDKVDPRKVAPPQFPTDGDYHELSCKRRHKANRSEAGYKSTKSSIKAPRSNSSFISESGHENRGEHTNNNQIMSCLSNDSTNARSSNSNNNNQSQLPNINTSTAVTADTSFQLPDNMLEILNNQLQHLIPNTDAIIRQLQMSNITDNDNIKETLERILEPYIKQLLLNGNHLPSLASLLMGSLSMLPNSSSINGQNISKSMDSRGSDVLGSGHSTVSGSADSHKLSLLSSYETISPNNLSEKQL